MKSSLMTNYKESQKKEQESKCVALFVLCAFKKSSCYPVIYFQELLENFTMQVWTWMKVQECFFFLLFKGV